MAATAADEHRDRARAAQQRGDLARRRARDELEAAERSERLTGEETDLALADVHRHAAALHRGALEQYQALAELESARVNRALRAAAQADASETGDRHDGDSDERDQIADLREEAADLREHRADEREHSQDRREEQQDERERHLDQLAGRAAPSWTALDRDRIARARTALRRVEARLARSEARLRREDALAGRDQDTIDRESAATARREPPLDDRS